MPDPVPIQHLYPEDVAHCYGCGRLNDHGLHIQSVWDGDQTVSRLTPRPEHTAIPGYIYGGLVASLIDCHGTGSAALAARRAKGEEGSDQPAPRFVTAALQVSYRAPTPMGVELVARGTIKQRTDRKVVTEITVHAGETLCAEGEVVAVPMPASMVGAH